MSIHSLDLSPLFKTSQCTVKIDKGGLLLYVNENVSGKVNITYEFKGTSEIIVLEFRISKKKWLLLGN